MPPAAAGGQAGEDDWHARLVRHLERFKRYPRQAERLRQQGVVAVRLRVGGSGQLQEALVVHSSGVPALDEEALATVRRASPLPAPPAHLGPPVVVVLPVQFRLSR